MIKTLKSGIRHTFMPQEVIFYISLKKRGVNFYFKNVCFLSLLDSFLECEAEVTRKLNEENENFTKSQSQSEGQEFEG